MNDIISVVGNIATQPEAITTSTGKSLTRLRLASSSRRFNSAQNTWEEGHTNWYTVRAWGKLAEHVSRSVHKGEQIIVRGRLKIETNTGENGQTYTNISIDADQIGASLQFGTTQFQRSAERSAPAPDAGAAAAEFPPASAASIGADESTPF